MSQQRLLAGLVFAEVVISDAGIVRYTLRATCTLESCD
jgi:hypothetical protein